LREERRFGGIDELKAQIAADLEHARRICASRPTLPVTRA
jgi:FAD synthase